MVIFLDLIFSLFWCYLFTFLLRVMFFCCSLCFAFNATFFFPLSPSVSTVVPPSPSSSTLPSWWKLSEASPSATVFTYTRLCPLLKAFLCCSTLWALSCLVFLLVTLLALTDSQVNCVARAACVSVFVHLCLSIYLSHACVCCDITWNREIYVLKGIYEGTL